MPSRFITIDGFKGGLGQSPADPLEKQTFQTARDLDVFIYSNILRPHAKRLTAVTLPANFQPKNSILASDSRYYFVGTDSSTSKKILYSIGDLQTGTWRVDFGNSSTNSSSTALDIVEFKDRLYFAGGTVFEYLKSWGPFDSPAASQIFTVTIASPAVFTCTTHGLVVGDTVRLSGGTLPNGLDTATLYYIISSGLGANTFQVSLTNGGTAVNTSGSQSGTHFISKFSQNLATGSAVQLLKVHEGLGKLFFVHNSNRSVGYYDGTTVTASALVLPENERIICLEPYGSYMLVGVRGTVRSRVLVWDGAATTVADIMNLNDSGLQGMRVVGNRIVALCTSIVTSNPILRIYQGNVGGNFDKVREEAYPGKSAGIYPTTANILNNAIDVYGGILYFGPIGDLGATNLGVMAYDPETNLLTPSRITSRGTPNANYKSVKYNPNGIVITYTDDPSDTNWYIDEMGSSDAYDPNGVYESNAFPLRFGLKGKIKQIHLNHEPIPSDGGFTVQVKHLGTGPWGSTVPSVRAVTITIASPAVFTLVSHGFVAGDRVRFETLGLLPTGLQPFKTYYVISAGLTTDDFEVSETSGGSAVNTTGSQSGVHSIDPYVDLKGIQGNPTTSGLTQSTPNATFTEIKGEDFVEATYASIKILYDEIGTSLQPLSLIFPIIIEVEE